MTQEVLLSKGDLVVDLCELLSGSEAGMQALAGITGMGFPDVDTEWFEGAGDGAEWIGSRALPRELDLPLLIEGGSPAGVQELISRLARLFDPSTGLTRLWLVRDEEERFTDVVRVGGGKWVSGKDSDGETWARTLITVRAGDPFWTRQDASEFEVRIKAEGRGLLPKLMSLRLTSSQAMGERAVENPGDMRANPVWRVDGPGRNFTAISPIGEVLRWTGALAAGETLTIDTKAGTVIDHTGANRYNLLAPAPRFWSIEPGESTVSVTLDGATSDSRITCSWQPRWWATF